MTAFDDYIDLKTWIKTLGQMGLTARETFPDVHERMKRSDHVSAAITEYRNTASTNFNNHARRIAAGNTDTAGIIELANQAAHETKPDHRERVLEVLERTLEFAQSSAYRKFKNRGASILEVIRPQFDELATRLVNAASTIPQGAIKLEDAARLGYADEYLQLERDIEQWNKIAALIREWTDAGILEETRSRFPIEYMVEDPEAYRTVSASSSRPLRTAQGIAAGTPRLHVPTGAPLAPLLNDSGRWATRDANDADLAAREELGLPTLTR